MRVGKIPFYVVITFFTTIFSIHLAGAEIPEYVDNEVRYLCEKNEEQVVETPKDLRILNENDSTVGNINCSKKTKYEVFEPLGSNSGQRYYYPDMNVYLTYSIAALSLSTIIIYSAARMLSKRPRKYLKAILLPYGIISIFSAIFTIGLKERVLFNSGIISSLSAFFTGSILAYKKSKSRREFILMTLLSTLSTFVAVVIYVTSLKGGAIT